MINFDAPPISNVIEILLRGLNIDKLDAVKPRAFKSDAEKIFRTRTLAEVFTPSRVVKFMVDALDDEQIDSRWLEIACGEAPFITNRYDAESGEIIPPNYRAGILDRKLRRAKNFFEASRAVQSVYGCELQADSLLIARANVLLTAAEFINDYSAAELAELAEIITKNFCLLDILKPPPVQMSLFDDAIDWNTGNEIFLGGNGMKKFDFVISNPPYQDETSGDNKNYAPPVYNKIMDAAYKIADKAVFITPARFLFDAGATPKDWNKKMLNDPHLKVLDYAPDARKYFKGVDIKGGVAITLRDETKNFGAIGTFIPFAELRSIHQKVCVDNPNFRLFSDIIYSRKLFKLTEKFYTENPAAPTYLKDKNNYTIGTNAFAEMSEYFFDDKPNDGNEYVQILGLLKQQRVYRFIRRDYVNAPEALEKFKVFVPASNGSGALGEVVSTPLVGSPLVGCTETFITVGAFDSETEARACLAYIKSKFCRVMLGILKVTQHNTSETWAKVPLQDFSAASDIDWGGNVDAQLYRKYKLDAAEINFIEKHVKEMI